MLTNISPHNALARSAMLAVVGGTQGSASGQLRFYDIADDLAVPKSPSKVDTTIAYPNTSILCSGAGLVAVAAPSTVFFFTNTGSTSTDPNYATFSAPYSRIYGCHISPTDGYFLYNQDVGSGVLIYNHNLFESAWAGVEYDATNNMEVMFATDPTSLENFYTIRVSVVIFRFIIDTTLLMQTILLPSRLLHSPI